MRSSIILLLLLAAAVPSFAADIADMGRPAVRVFSIKDGLPQNTVQAIAIDHKKHLWVGTQDGAAYFNGRKWTVVNMPMRNVSNDVRAILAASDGSILFGTFSGGLSKLKDDKWTVYDTSSGLPDNRIKNLLETVSADGKSILWVGTVKGLARFEDGSWTIFNAGSGLPSAFITCLLETISPDGNRTLWAGAEKGLARYENGNWTAYDKSSGLPDNHVKFLSEIASEDGNRITILGTESGGLARFDNGRWVPFKIESSLPLEGVQNIVETISNGERTLWIGTTNGLARLRNGSWSILDNRAGMPNNWIRSLFKVRTEAGGFTLWAGTHGGGLVQIEENRWTIFDESMGLPKSPIWTMLESISEQGKPVYWIGAHGGGLVRIEENRLSIYDVKSGLPSNAVRSLLETVTPEGKRILWVGTFEGLSKLEDGRWTTYNAGSGLPNNLVISLLHTVSDDGASSIWAGTNGGLARFENGKWTIFKTDSGLPHNWIWSLLETRSPDGTRSFWAGTNGGLAKLENGKWTVYDMKSGLPNNQVMSLHETTAADGRRFLWAGTFAGAARLDLTSKNAKWIMLSDSSRPALPNNTVYQIREDAKKRIYLFTIKGISRLTPRTPTDDDPSEFSIYTFTSEDGLPSDECNHGASMVDSRGRIWAGTVEGAAMLDPSRELEDRSQKPLYIERTIFGSKDYANLESSPIGDGMLEHYENNLTFEYSLLSFFRESDTRYRTQLAGYDDELSEWTTDFKRGYTNLGEGDYSFKVWGKDYAGNISGPVTVSFRIRPAPWRSWWAYAAYALAALSGAYGAMKYRFLALQRRAAMLEAKVAERTDELATALERIKQSQEETEGKNKELAWKNEELMESHNRADRIFSALAEALPGTVLDEKYRLDEKIGSGGFGAVYRATHLAMKRPVAVKIFKPAPGNDSADALERFRLEAVSACRINHPNAVAVLDSGISSEGIAYLVMELLEGRSLTVELKRRKTLSIERAAQILIPVCNALSKAHSMGIVHRDVKPDNIFLHRAQQGETVKIVDFGIAKLMERSDSIDIKSLTLTGGLLGTPTYMSPERIEGKPYDGRSDVYSLGVVLYEMLCGQAPFESDLKGVFGVVRMHVTKEPQPLREINSEISEAVEAAVLRALAKDPANRPNAAELGREFLAAAGIDPASLSYGGASFDEDSFADEGERAERGITAQNKEQTGLTTEVFRRVEKLAQSMLEREPDTAAAFLKERALIEAGAAKEKALTPERWRQMENIFYSAIECDPEGRDAYLNEACCGDADLRSRVEAMIAADGDF